MFFDPLGRWKDRDEIEKEEVLLWTIWFVIIFTFIVELLCVAVINHVKNQNQWLIEHCIEQQRSNRVLPDSKILH